MCRTPPKSYLATPGALASLGLASQALGISGANAGPDQERVFGGVFSSVDLADAFYMFLFRAFLCQFDLPIPIAAGDVDVKSALDAEGNRATAEPSQSLWPCL